MKSICVLVQSCYDFDVRVRRKVEALVAAGYSVDVYALRTPEGRKQYTLNGVNVYTVSLGKQRGSLVRYGFEYVAFFLWALASITARMRRRRYVVIDVNTLPDFLIFAGVFARWMGSKLVLDMHEITPEFYRSKYGATQNSWQVRLLTYLERISFDFADHVVTINEPVQDLLANRGLPYSKSIVMMNSVDEARFSFQRNTCPEAEAAATNAKFIMMYHGTLTKLYGLDIAIEALAIVESKVPGTEFWIIGEGPEEVRLRKLARERNLETKVKFMGPVRHSQVPAWLRKCDLGLMPIRGDVYLEFASPNKLSEFILAGKPVAISRLRAIRHYFSPDALGFFEPNDPAALASQIVRFYEDIGLRTRMASRAMEEYAPIRWEVMKQRYLKLIESITNDGSMLASIESDETVTPCNKAQQRQIR
jgi:glycosyltransferase involved in cell wall biosynthesis